MTKKNMFRIGAVLMVCVMLLSSFSFAATETHAGTNGYVTFACSAGLTSSSASTSSTNGANYCTVTLSAYYAWITDGSGTPLYEGPSSDYKYGDGAAVAQCSYALAVSAEAYSSHSAPGCSGSLSDRF